MDQLLNAGFSCVDTGNFNHVRIYIISLNICINIKVDLISHLITDIFPVGIRNKMFPTLSCKMSVKTRCYACCHHSRLYRKCSATAKWINKYPVRFPRSQHKKCCCQILSDRCFGLKSSISSFMKGISCSIKSNSNLILHDKYSYRKTLSVFLEPVCMIALLHTFNHGLFHDTLYIRWAKELTLDA